MNTIKFSYPKGAATTAELNKKFKDFRESHKTPTLSSLPKTEKPVPMPVKGVHLFADDVAMIHSITKSSNPLSEAISNQNATPDQIIGTLSSSFLTLEFVKMQSVFKKAMDSAKTDANKKTLNASYQEGIKGFKSAYNSIGLKGIDEQHMVSFSKELVKDKKAFDSIVKINNSKVAVKSNTKSLTGEKAVAMGNFETVFAMVNEPSVGNLLLPANLCSTPFAQGSFTKHFGHSFNLQVSISLPCIVSWGGPFGCHCIPNFGWCKHTYTLANLSYNVDLSVGYKVTCCGGSAWGFASANVCASLLGHQFCAGCSASIIGVVGIARTPQGGKCIYGLGLKAELKCTFVGITVLNVVYPFGYTLTGPCPPLPC